MDVEQALDLLPRYTQGKLSVGESLQVSQALAEHPELLVDLRMVLELRQAMQEEERPLPPFPQAIYQESPKTISALHKGLSTLRKTNQITRSAIRAAFRFI